jgi:hypothetical protein
MDLGISKAAGTLYSLATSTDGLACTKDCGGDPKGNRESCFIAITVDISTGTWCLHHLRSEAGRRHHQLQEPRGRNGVTRAVRSQCQGDPTKRPGTKSNIAPAKGRISRLAVDTPEPKHSLAVGPRALLVFSPQNIRITSA